MKSKNVTPNKSIKLPATEHTNVEIDNDNVLYIYVRDWNAPPSVTRKMLDRIRKDFKDALPDTKIIIGINDLQFSIITKKQAFKGKLSGEI